MYYLILSNQTFVCVLGVVFYWNPVYEKRSSISFLSFGLFLRCRLSSLQSSIIGCQIGLL